MYVRCLRWLCVAWVWLATLASGALAADMFPGTVLGGSSGTVVGTTSGMTGEAGEPNFIGGATTSDWYSWTAPASGRFTIATCNLSGETTTATDTTLAAYTGAAVNALTAVGSNDDTTGCNSTVNPNYGSFLTFTVTAGVTYRFQVDTYNSSATGTFVLRYGLSALTVAVSDPSATEGGDTATFTVRPASPPSGSSAVTVTIGTSTQCSFSPTTLTFTSANFTTPQTVTVTATNDAVAEGTHSCSPATLSAAGTGYAGVTATPPTMTVYDNDNPNFTITKSVSAAAVAAPGTLTYTITVDNNGSAILTNPVITDTLQLNGTPIAPTSGPTLTSGDTNGDGILQDTETWVYTVTHNVTQANIDGGGSFTNVATWACTEVAVKTSNTVTTTITRTPNIAVDKSFVITTDNGTIGTADVGDVITYSYAVTNTGNVTLSNVTVGDVHSGTGGPPVPAPASVASLAPSATATFTATYQVTQGDVDNQ
ncbi:MAG: DUF11 domain-containing protein [Rhizobiales bacterium]|nr:DUF11 domain-containing protein [Hyphomicrobiales bacterium]